MTDFQSFLAKDDLQKYLRAALFAFALLALVMNIAGCWKIYRAEPLRDAASRSLMAAESSWFYASGLAEPVPVAALKLAMAAGANPDKAVRLQGLAVYVLMAVLTLLLLRPLGELTPPIAALFLAANPYMGYYAMLGSSNLFALLFLLLFWHFFYGARGRRGALLAGAAGGLACLSRLDAAWMLLVIAGLSWALRRREFRLKEAGLALGLAALLTLPYLAWQRAHYGSAFYAQELSLRRWANIDRYGYRPTEPVPQGPLAPAAFLLRNGPAGALGAAFSGLGRALAYELPRVLYHKFMMVLVFLGVYAAFVFRKERLLVFLTAALLPLLPLAAVTQVPASGGIELRYYLPALWALCALAGYGLQEVMAWLEAAVIGWAREKAQRAAARAGKK
jgi:4-amino-4-deoxy-L-arabinose transferase-like glycosyltransferase